MPGPTQPWDQSADPRESTVDLPRLDLAGLADYFSGGAGSPAAERAEAGADPRPDPAPASPRPPEETGFGHPYADPSEVAYARLQNHAARAAVAQWEAADQPPDVALAISAVPDSNDASDPAADPNAGELVPIMIPLTDAASTAGPSATAEPHLTLAPAPRDAPIAGRLTPPSAAPDPPKRPHRPMPAERAPAGSLADLRSRLARLPDGHPSSPYDDGGRLRPLPIRLKQLELGLPAPGRGQMGSPRPETGANGVAHAGPDTGPHRPPNLAQPDSVQSHRPQSDPDQPNLVQSDLDSADPDAASNGHPAADLDLGPRRATGHEPRVSGLESLSGGSRSGHARANGRSATHTRPGDADGADEGQLRLLVDRTLESCRLAEGRNVFGGYGSSGLTPAIERIAANLPFGGLATGSQTDTVKSSQRLVAKLARLVARNPGRTPAELLAAIPDAIRYAFVFEAADYVEGTWLVHRRFKSSGFELEVRRNRWESPEYKGIFTQWRDPAHRVAFEVQFHTPASWGVVQRTHAAYVQVTDPATPPADRARLRARQVTEAAAAKAPPSWAEITDFRLEPR